MLNQKKPAIPKSFIDDAEGNYDIDGVSLSQEGVVVSGDKLTPTEDKKRSPKKKKPLRVPQSKHNIAKDSPSLQFGFDETLDL